METRKRGVNMGDGRSACLQKGCRRKGRSIEIFERQSHAHSARDAQSGQATLGVALAHFVQEGGSDSCAGAANWMPQGDRSAIYVHLAVVHVQFTVASQHLCGEGFV